jgi:rRNA maturation endonuclease Nob1
MGTRPWKRERVIEFPRSQRSTEPLQIAHGLYCGACGAFCTTNDAFCGMCGAHLWKEGALNDTATMPFGLTGANWLHC